MIDVLSYFVSLQFVESLFIIIILGFFLKAINRYLIKREKTNPKSERKKSTTIGIVLSTLRYVAVLSAVFIVLSINGIDPTGIFAGLGIVATIVGLALQDTLKDILSGINIYNNNFYKVGDVVEYDGKTCEVKLFNDRDKKLRDIFKKGSRENLLNNILASFVVNDCNTFSLKCIMHCGHNLKIIFKLQLGIHFIGNGILQTAFGKV